MNSEMTLWDYLRVIRRRMKIILAIPVFGLLASWIYANNLTPRYSTTSQLMMHKNVLREGAGLQRGAISVFERSTFERIASNKDVAQLAARRLMDDQQKEYLGVYASSTLEDLVGQIRSDVLVENVENSNLLTVSSSGADAVRCVDYCNAYARSAVDYYESERRRGISDLREYLTAQIERYTKRMEELDGQLLLVRSGRSNAADLDNGSLTRVDESIARAESDISSQRAAHQRLAAALAARHVNELLIEMNQEPFAASREELNRKRSELDGLLRQYTDAHPKVQQARENLNLLQEQVMAKLVPAAEERLVILRKQIDDEMLERTRLVAERDMVNAAIASLPDRLRQEGSIQRELGIVSSVNQMFRSRLEDINLSLSTPADRLEISELAVLPKRPYYPDKKVIVGIGLAISAMLSLSLAFLLESLDTSLTAMKDVERFIAKPILAVIPAIRIPQHKIEQCNLPIKRELLEKLPLVVDQRSPAAESYRTLRAVVQSRFLTQGRKTLLVTSTTPQEGKTTTVINLSLACADAGLKTVLVGANMRHPVVGRHFQIDRSRGLHDVLIGAMKPEEALQETGHANLSIIDSGSFARRPAELLSRKEFDALLEWLKARFDIVLVDSPPTLPVADAATIAPKVDGILLVYLVSVAPRDALLRCKNMLEEVGGNIIGIVFNDIWGASQIDYAGYYYHHKYASDEFRRI